MVTQKQKMLAGEPYMANDPELEADYARAQSLLTAFNATQADDANGLVRILKNLLGHLGADTIVKPTFRCDYGSNIRIGARSFVNYDCVLLDCNMITIGEEVQIAPGVHIYTATHPLDAATRRIGLESAHPVVVGDGVWLGGRVVVCPGVTIGENTVVGTGSVVTKNLPPNVLAVGNPCRVVRSL
ncbi:maltose transacetylase [Fulvimarina pelagi HTCC2506]|uniref:Acetyltransferase n=1 Tax=Fulvimarina pelagi HTCC2506 TaxID=314231 RepID=Q0G5Z3_9HYPH|nr:sugar O-acetyltransferase [Fulvimarina pelagi]EAU42921.1 maltose transacetylase [Fulvimarina pelagi HTCC2506]